MQYRVIDARGETVQSEQIVDAATPEAAAKTAFGLDLVRSGRIRDLVARIYWQPAGSPKNMVRLYSKTAY